MINYYRVNDYGNWNIYVITINDIIIYILFLIFLVAITKRTQIPFSSRLPI